MHIMWRIYNHPRGVVAIKNFFAHVKNTDQNFADQNFHLIELELVKIPYLLFSSSYMSETLHVTSSKDILVTHVTLWEKFFEPKLTSAKFAKMTFFAR